MIHAAEMSAGLGLYGGLLLPPDQKASVPLADFADGQNGTFSQTDLSTPRSVEPMKMIGPGLLPFITGMLREVSPVNRRHFHPTGKDRHRLPRRDHPRLCQEIEKTVRVKNKGRARVGLPPDRCTCLRARNRRLSLSDSTHRRMR